VNWVQSPGDVAAVLSIIGVVLGVLWFLIDVRVAKILKELKPNGGDSFSDRLERNHRELRDELLTSTERIERKIDKHLGWHMDQVSADRGRR